MNRFDLEEQMSACWNTKDDIDLLCESILKNDMSKDEISNALLGISQLHEMRCHRTFETFKVLVHNGTIGSIDSDDNFLE